MPWAPDYFAAARQLMADGDPRKVIWEPHSPARMIRGWATWG